MKSRTKRPRRTKATTPRTHRVTKRHSPTKGYTVAQEGRPVDAFSQGRDRWVDVHGKAPKLDKKGALAEVFTTALYSEDGSLMKVERWGVGVRLPVPPGILEQEALERERKRAKEQGVSVRTNGEVVNVKLTRKPRQRSDEGLTPEQLAKRNKRRARREARKRRKGGKGA